MTKPKGLGRGLDALLGQPANATRSSSVHPDDVQGFPSDVQQRITSIQAVEIADIEANPNQPRREFEERALIELAESIEAHGIIQPITLRKIRASKYQIISGERRFRAAQRVGLTSLPAYVREANDQALLEMALVENLQREDLNPLEVGMSFQHLMDECGLTQDVLAQRVGMGRSSVANYLRLLDLPVAIQTMLRNGALTMGHAKALAGARGENAPYLQIALAEKTVGEGASVRQLEAWVKQGGLTPAPSRSSNQVDALSEDEIQTLDRLRLKLSGTKANLSLHRQPHGGGQLVLKYQSADDLEVILRKLGFA